MTNMYMNMPPKRGTAKYDKWKDSPGYSEFIKNRSGEKSPMFGHTHTVEARKRISKSRLGTHRSAASCIKQSQSISGEKNPRFGKHLPLKTRKKISASLSGEKNPMFGKYGKNHPMYGYHPSEENRNLQSEMRRGEKCHLWKGGVSFGKYCYKFSRDLKRRVRTFFKHRCVECGKTQEKNGRALDVHHVNYNKMVCCNDVKPLFVALCHSHNALANFNREYWEQHYTEIINEKYDGQCYLPIAKK